jgi:hypothetical protein
MVLGEAEPGSLFFGPLRCRVDRIGHRRRILCERTLSGARAAPEPALKRQLDRSGPWERRAERAALSRPEIATYSKGS